MDSGAPTYTVSDDPARIDRDRVWRWLHDESYWAKGRPREVFDRALDNSLVVGAYQADDGTQAGFLRVVTDRATFAWICDVFVFAEHRGRGVAKLMVEAALHHPDVEGLRRVMLATHDAHDLYRQAGFTDLSHPERWMQLEAGPAPADLPTAEGDR